MFKQIAVIIAMLVLFTSVSAFAQSFDVDVHNVDLNGGTVQLTVTYFSGGPVTRTAPSSSTTIHFNDIPTSQSNPALSIKATQDGRSDEKIGGLAPFFTYHLYLGELVVDPTTPEND